ncbi:MAG TPA: sulfite exporter TauE/SafE family protein [Euzebyales bacterium]|nr:sulfite exporter TauE/SafE family protein [Euzebyales bacterium]
MLGSISPVGEASRQQRWWVTATAHVTASAVAGAATGAVLGAAGQALLAVAAVPVRARLAVLAGIVVVAAASDAFAPGRLPTWHRQVDERWLTTYRGWVYGAGFGAQLGAGVTTIVTSAATYAALAAAVLAGSWAAGLLIGAAFGVSRGVPLVLMAPVRTADRLYAVTRLVAASEPRMRRLTIAGQSLLAVCAAVAATGA